MIENDSMSVLQSSQVIEMLTVANDFCIFTESINNREKTEIINYYQKVMPLLYLKGSLLPEVEVSDESAYERFVSEEHWENIFNACRQKLEHDDEYWYPDLNEELMKESLSDNIADIYQDMKDFVILFQVNRLAAKENALAECRSLFINHWGERCIKALKQFHYLQFKDLKTEDLNYFD